MQRKPGKRAKAVLLFMGLLVLLPFIAVFLAAIPASQHAGPAPRVTVSATAQGHNPAQPDVIRHAPHAVPKQHAHVTARARNTARTYVVKAGDTLSAIAAHFHVKGGWPALYHANHGTVGGNPNLIFAGQRLQI